MPNGVEKMPDVDDVVKDITVKGDDEGKKQQKEMRERQDQKQKHEKRRATRRQGFQTTKDEALESLKKKQEAGWEKKAGGTK